MRYIPTTVLAFVTFLIAAPATADVHRPICHCEDACGGFCVP